MPQWLTAPTYPSSKSPPTPPTTGHGVCCCPLCVHVFSVFNSDLRVRTCGISFWYIFCSNHNFFLLYFRFWGTCADHAGLLHRYTHGNVVCCLHPPITYIWHFSLCYPSPTSPPPPAVPPLVPPQQSPVCDASLPLSMCSHCSSPTYE